MHMYCLNVLSYAHVLYECKAMHMYCMNVLSYARVLYVFICKIICPISKRWLLNINPFIDTFIQDFFFPEKKNPYLFRKAMKYLATIVYEKAPTLRIILHPLMVAKQPTIVP